MSSPADSLDITEHRGAIELAVKVVPGSSRTRIAGTWQSALRVTVAAPPEAGKANKLVVRLLADALGVKRAAVTITHGRGQPLKRVRIAGLSADLVRRKLSVLLA